MNITVNFKAEMKFDHMARTLHPEDLGLRESGWVIVGEVHEDYYEWVNFFVAIHPDFGWVYGDYEHELHGMSKKALDHFMTNHPASEWDYYDI